MPSDQTDVDDPKSQHVAKTIDKLFYQLQSCVDGDKVLPIYYSHFVGLAFFFFILLLSLCLFFFSHLRG